MQFVDFSEANTVLLAPKGQEETCGDLPVFNDGEVSVSCWTVSPEELEEINRTGKVWVMIFGGKSQPPMSVMGQYPFIPAPDPAPEQEQETMQRVDAEQRNRERMLALLEQEATSELEAQRGLDIKGYFQTWRRSQTSLPLDSPTYWNDVRMMFLELGGQLLPEGENIDDQLPVLPDQLANGTPEDNAQFVAAFNGTHSNLSAN